MKLEELFIREDATILQTMKQLDETGQRILFIAPEGRLQAVLTDGDLRKFLLRGGKLEDPVRLAANYSPKSLPLEERGRAKSMLERHSIDALPLLDRDGKVADVVFATGLDVDNRKQANIPVVVMAGGLGTRLYPYTKILPKPLIPVGEKPICELILERFSDFGCRRMLLVVNYKKNMIKSYFNDLEDLRYQVEYVDETEFLGTGGGLNVSFYSNTEVDDLLAKARVITDETQRGEYYKEVQTILSQDLPILPLVEYAGYYACPSYISGLPYIDTDVDDINAYNFSKVTINK